MLLDPKSRLGFIFLARGGELNELDVNLLVKTNELVVLKLFNVLFAKSCPETKKGESTAEIYEISF